MSVLRPYLRDLKALLSGWVTSPVVSRNRRRNNTKQIPFVFPLWSDGASIFQSPPHFQTMIHYAQRGSCFDLPELWWKRFCAREITAGCPNYSQMGAHQRRHTNAGPDSECTWKSDIWNCSCTRSLTKWKNLFQNVKWFHHQPPPTEHLWG